MCITRLCDRRSVDRAKSHANDICAVFAVSGISGATLSILTELLAALSTAWRLSVLFLILALLLLVLWTTQIKKSKTDTETSPATLAPDEPARYTQVPVEAQSDKRTISPSSSLNPRSKAGPLPTEEQQKSRPQSGSDSKESQITTAAATAASSSSTVAASARTFAFSGPDSDDERTSSFRIPSE